MYTSFPKNLPLWVVGFLEVVVLLTGYNQYTITTIHSSITRSLFSLQPLHSAALGRLKEYQACVLAMSCAVVLYFPVASMWECSREAFCVAVRGAERGRL